MQATVGEPPGRISLDGARERIDVQHRSRTGATADPPGTFFRKRYAARRNDPYAAWRAEPVVVEQRLRPAGCDRFSRRTIIGDGRELDLVDRFAFRDYEMEMVCGRLYRELSLGGAADRLYMESLVMKLAVLLRQRHSTTSPVRPIPQSSSLTRNQARRVLDYIEANLSRQLTLSELAKIAGLSLHHFARMFKQTLGVAPYRYVLQRRVERAKLMLRTARASLVDISLSAGFYSQSHFTSTFGRMVGATPTEFQESNRKHSP